MCPIGTKFTWIENWDIFKFDCKIQFSKVLYLKNEFLWNWSLLKNSLKARFLSVCFHVLVSRAFPQLLDPQHEQASLLFEPRQGGINAKLPQNYCFWCVVTNFTFTTGELEILILFCVGQRIFCAFYGPFARYLRLFINESQVCLEIVEEITHFTCSGEHFKATEFLTIFEKRPNWYCNRWQRQGL